MLKNPKYLPDFPGYPAKGKKSASQLNIFFKPNQVCFKTFQFVNLCLFKPELLIEKAADILERNILNPIWDTLTCSQQPGVESDSSFLSQ